MDQLLKRNRLAMGKDHPGGQPATDRLSHAEHGPLDPARHAQLRAYHRVAAVHPVPDEQPLRLVRPPDIKKRVNVSERGDRLTLSLRHDQGVRELPRASHRYAAATRVGPTA